MEKFRICRDQMCMEWALSAARRSTCMRNQVGAVIVMDGRPLSIGYNGAPPGRPHCNPETCNDQNPCDTTVHAEANAIAWAARKGVAIEGADLYLTLSPCLSCAKLILAAGIRRVIFDRFYRESAGLNLLASGTVGTVPWVYSYHIGGQKQLVSQGWQ